MEINARPYEAIASHVTDAGSIDDRMKRVVDALWEALADQDVSWVGFYTDQPDEPDDRRLVLGPHRDKPACSPIGLHGVCGQALRFRRPRIVEDVADLGEDYIACDPSDRSEIVIPLLNSEGRCWAVLDLDSTKEGAFDKTDEQGLTLILAAAGLIYV